MTKQEIFEQLKGIQTLAWKQDDWMEQESLFDLQERVANLTLAVAQDIGNTALKDLCKTFPYLYSVR